MYLKSFGYLVFGVTVQIFMNTFMVGFYLLILQNFGIHDMTYISVVNQFWVGWLIARFTAQYHGQPYPRR